MEKIGIYKNILVVIAPTGKGTIPALAKKSKFLTKLEPLKPLRTN